MLGRNEDGEVLFYGLEVVPDLGTGDGVKAGSGFVEEDQAAFGEAEDGEAEVEFSFVAEGEVLGVSIWSRPKLNLPILNPKHLKMLLSRQILNKHICLKTKPNLPFLNTHLPT